MFAQISNLISGGIGNATISEETKIDAIESAPQQNLNSENEGINDDDDMEDIDEFNSGYGYHGIYKVEKKDKEQTKEYEIPIFNTPFRLIQSLMSYIYS
jgi:hypothetical protein